MFWRRLSFTELQKKLKMAKVNIKSITTIRGDLRDLLLYRPDLSGKLNLLGVYDYSFETGDDDFHFWKGVYALMPLRSEDFTEFLESGALRIRRATHPNSLSDPNSAGLDVDAFLVNYRIDHKRNRWYGDASITIRETNKGDSSGAD